MSEMKVTPWSEAKWHMPPGVANLKVADIQDTLLVITKAEPVSTSFGEAARFTCEFKGLTLEILTHSKVLLKQLLAVAEFLPLECTIIKSGRSFTLS